MPLFSSARAPAAASPKKVDEAALAYSERYSAGDSFCTWVSFFLFLWFTPLSFVCFYHAAPTTVVSLAFLWVAFTLMPWAFHEGGSVSSDVSGPMLTVTLFMSVILSALGGVRCYYEHAQPLRQLALARDYKGVYPELPGVGFPDAAYLEFSGNATIDTSKTVMYQSLDSGLSTICVAPIVTSVSSGRHDFWAIGVDCCGDHGEKFECYDAGDASVKTGWVLPYKFGDKLFSMLGVWLVKAEYRRDLFGKAVEKAEAIYGITTPGEGAIFVRWTKQTKGDIEYWETVSIVIAMTTIGLIFGALSYFMEKLYQRFQHIRSVHRRQHHFGLHGDTANSEEEDMTARLQQFMSDAMEGNAGDFHADMNSGGAAIDRTRAIKNHMKRFRPPLSASDMCAMGVVLPYVMLMLCVLLSTYMPCSKFGHLILAPFWCLTFIFVIALLATPNRAVNGFFLLICCSVGYYIGNVNYKENMFHYCSVGDRRLYTDVKADANTADYWDAGRLNFDSSSMLSTNHSVGFVYQGTTYCAAPVVSKNVRCNDGSPLLRQQGSSADPIKEQPTFLQVSSGNASEVSDFENQNDRVLAAVSAPALTFMQRRSSRHHSRRAHLKRSSSREVEEYGGCKNIAPPQVEFWAIGENCCDARKRFWCDGGDLKKARQAVVVRAFGDEDHEGPKIESDRMHYFQAIDQAVATFNLPAPDRPVLLRWGMDSDDLRAEWKKRSVGLIMMTGLASLLLILLLGITSFCFMKRQRRLEQTNEADYDRRSGGAEATVYDNDTPRQSLQPAQSVQDLRSGRGGMSDADLERRLKASEDEMRF